MAKKAARKRSVRAESQPSAAAVANEKLIAKLRHHIRTEGANYLRDPNVTSVGIGYRIADGKRGKAQELCLQFTVKAKPDDHGALPEGIKTERIPPELEIGGESIPTDVIQRDYRPSFQILELNEVQTVDVRKRRHETLVPGISVSHPLGTAGTLGMIVHDSLSGDPCMLSNWHVLHGAHGRLGDTVVQPGPHDNNRVTDNAAGVLVRSHLGPAGDCAIARIENREFVHEILELAVVPRQIARVELGDRVIKSGRTTGITKGIVRRIDVLARIPYPDVGKVVVGAFEIEPLPGASSEFEISMGGDSGAVWMIARQNGQATDVLVGLHFAGEGPSSRDEHALACYAHSVFKKLQLRLEPPAELEALHQAGYDPNFLDQPVPVPGLPATIRQDTFEVDGSRLIPYTHFSVCQSMSRRLPRFVAWNIDGGRLKRVSRRGLRFRLDRRVPNEFQAGNELYADNRLDRGHVARRADLAWGSIAEAQQANRDSFFFTNITPQHEAFNQSSRSGLWGELENAVFAEVEVTDLRISVVAGPIFRDDDQRLRGVQIPRSFWKLIAYHDIADERFEVRAYVLTQEHLLDDIEALDLDPFRLFQVSLARLRGETQLDFGELDDFDTLTVGPKSLAAGVREIRHRDELIQ